MSCRVFLCVLFCACLPIGIGPLFAREYSEIFLATLPVDIRNSSVIELVEWCRRLNLDTAGKREDLERRLYSFYSLEYKKNEDVKPRIIIQRSGLGSYDTGDQDTDYISLTGEVMLEMIDDETGESHRISADRIVFNEKSNSVTAIGNITYVLDKGDNTEIFTGDQLTFNMDHWGGVFFDGVTERETTINEESIRFRFEGERIIRDPYGRILLEKGTITSSKKEDPYYRIKCSKIWVFREGDWVLEHPVLYIGRIPMLYVPFFFKQKDEIFFNPSFGMDDTGNAFLYTTYYLFGQKEKEEGGDFSFMSLGDVTDEKGPKKIREIYLVDDPSPEGFGKNLYDWASKTGSYSKLMIDYYTMMGLFASVDTKINMDKFSGDFWIGGANSFFPNTSRGVKTLYWTGSDGQEIVREHTWAAGQYIPFRWGIDLHGDFSFPNGKLSVSIPWYSDPYFRRVFDTRYESIQWGKILGLEDTGFEEIDLDDKNSSPLLTAATNYSLKIPALEPFVSSINIQKLGVSLQLREGTLNRSVYSDGEIAERIPGWDAISGSNISTYPGYYFYYMHSLSLPDLSTSLSGTLLGGKKPSGRVNGKTEKTVILPEELVPPWESGTSEKEDSKPENVFVEPEQGKDLPVDVYTAPAFFGHNLAYTLNPVFKRERYLNTSRYGHTPEGLYGAPWDIDNELLYDRIYTRVDPVLTYRAWFFDSMLSFQERISIVKQITVIDSDKESVIPEDVLNSLLLDEKRQTFTTGTHSFSTVLTLPFSKNSGVVSRTSYDLTDEFYSYIYDTDMEQHLLKEFRFNRDSISTNRLSSSLDFNFLEWHQKFYVEYNLPPDLQRFNYRVQPSAGPARFSLSHGLYERDDNEWRSLPLEMSLGGNYDFGLKISQELKYDYGHLNINEEDVFDVRTGKTTISWSHDTPKILLSNTFDYRFNTLLNGEKSSFFGYSDITSLVIGPFSGSFTMRNQYGYTYNRTLGWIQSANQEFFPDTLKLNFNKLFDLPTFWKGRVKSSFNVNSSTTIAFQKFSQSNFFFEAILRFSVPEFLDFSLTSKSENNAIYMYIPYFTEQLETETLNVFSDLADSFNFFDRSKREQSNFNLNSLSMDITHYMRDWKLQLSYQGIPEAVTENGRRYYKWMPVMTILVSWSPIPEIKREVTYEKEEIVF